MGDFSKYIGDYSYYYTPERFGPLGLEQIGGTMLEPVTADTGAYLEENGDVRFRFYYPKVNKLEVSMRAGRQSMKFELEKDGEGYFSGVLSYDAQNPTWHGFRQFELIADGINVVSSRTPVMQGFRGPTNYIEVPFLDFDDYLMDRNVPRGALAFRLFRSKVTNSWHRCTVYTPSEYNTSPDKSYPVLYLHHPGAKNTDTAWAFQGKVPLIMDNLIAEGKAVPFIIVSNECGPQLPEDGLFGMDGYFRMLFEDCIPFIESEYRCLSDKWNRATAGASWGGMLSSQLAFTWPDKFANVGMISSGFRCVDTWPKLEDNHFLDWMKGNAKEVGKQYKLIFRSHGEIEYIGSKELPNEPGNPTLFEDEAFLSENGLDKLPCYKRIVFPGGKHMWDTFAKGFSAFAQVLFKD
ncbi:MAG: hypothetical protein LBQ95_05420 [Lachnospiraceae bacterium]|jgi:enterochelin esterase family protein|nr:hypothetical protein [Lachnospiraceae bacterium]